MLIGLALLAAIVTVPLLGGRLERLGELRFAASWAIVTAIGLQVMIVSVMPGGDPVLHRGVHLASYGFAAWFLWSNRRLSGLLVMALGGALNLVAIALNHGVMPASRGALERAGLAVDSTTFVNSGAVAHPRAPLLGDIFATPPGMPFSNVFSVGDVVLVLGALVLLHVACGSRVAPRLRAAAP